MVTLHYVCLPSWGTETVAAASAGLVRPVSGVPRIAVVGAGNMGHRHARVVAENPRCELVAVVDVDLQRARSVASEYGTASAVSVDDVEVDAVVLAVPTEHHFDLGLSLINRRIPLLIEKPIAPTFPEAQLMIEAAGAIDVPLMCGFVERFNPVVTTVRELLDGPVVHLVATRHSPPAEQIRSSVVSDPYSGGPHTAEP